MEARRPGLDVQPWPAHFLRLRTYPHGSNVFARGEAIGPLTGFGPDLDADVAGTAQKALAAQEPETEETLKMPNVRQIGPSSEPAAV